ncbi:hypothetical protein QQZ08_011213 [Neonectria magnoliae]|uniref:Extracellular membrane protein CFEM domain-containing protein n=1 Tax=Neonectria magnoliae TaxID=2732573 RepID=A0ABR1HCC3_9HYPO
MASRRSFWSSLPLLLLLAPFLALALENNFDSYPKNAQECLYKSANATDCTGDTGAELNACLCENSGGFVINTARCIGEKGGVDIDLVYSDLDTACDGTSTPLSISKSQFKKAAAEGETTTSTDASSTTASATESETAHVTTTSGGKTITVVPTQTDDSDNDDKGGGGLGTPATIGIGVGAAVIGAAIVGAFFFLRRRRRGGEEAHPMLNNPQYQGGGNAGHDYRENKPVWAAGGYSPNAGWNTPTGYAGAAGVPPPGSGTVFEMDGSGGAVPRHGAVEMPGSELHGGQHQGGWNR